MCNNLVQEAQYVQSIYVSGCAPEAIAHLLGWKRRMPCLRCAGLLSTRWKLSSCKEEAHISTSIFTLSITGTVMCFTAKGT